MSNKITNNTLTMKREEIEEKVKVFLIDDLEVDETVIKPEEMAGVETLSDFCDYIEKNI